MKSISLLFLSFLFIILSASVFGQNLHTPSNAVSFENEANSTSGWTGSAVFTSDTENPLHGQYAFRCVTSPTNGREVRFSYNAIVGQTYNISIWARRGSTSFQPAFASWTGFSGFTTRGIISSNWTEYTFSLVATSATPIIRAFTSPSTGTTQGSTIFIDRVSIFQVSDSQPPTPPGNLISSNITTTSTNLSWTASADNVAVTAYDIYRNNLLLTSLAGNITNLNLNDLTPATLYNFYVVARDAAGNISGQSNNISFTTLPDTSLPDAPAGLNASNTTSYQTLLAWSASNDNIGVINYEIFKDSLSIGVTPANVLEYTATGLEPGTTYEFAVAAKDAAGNSSAFSLPVFVATDDIDTIPPTVPENLIASEIATTSVVLTWNPSTDNTGVTNYEVFQDFLSIGLTGPQTTYTVTGLAATTTYSFNVVAKDLAGNFSDYSDTLIATTPESTIYTDLNSNLPTVSWTTKDLFVNGTAGIGTSPDPAYKLAVNGNIRAKEIIVETGWADFVFEKDYHLPSLSEVEMHILENGHLKDIPSAATVEKEGVNLGNISARLLQKIEELTLYSIEMEKRLRNLENENIQLRKLIADDQRAVQY